jgi:hypothetical protein
MHLPHVVIEGVSPLARRRFAEHMDSDRTGWHRRWTESIWRRHQDASNARLSGWQSPDDRRRRLIHFNDEYGVEGDHFVLRGTHVWVAVTVPDNEAAAYEAAIMSGLDAGGWAPERGNTKWRTWGRGDLQARLSIVHVHPEDEERGYALPSQYRTLTLVIRSRGYTTPAGLERRPWRWFHDVGMRPMLQPGTPDVIEPESIADFFPAQLELGCGPSTEAGIPHLSNLHRIYGVSRGDFSFIFNPEDDGLLEVLAAPETKYAQMTEIYRQCLLAQPTRFYHAIRELADLKLLVGPVITNNFDCLCAEMGLEEMSLRRYDTEPYFQMMRSEPGKAVEFHPDARSLLVVGVHADRRLAQMLARERGLTVLYVDPETYRDPAGRPMRYPVEAPQTGDRIVRLPAGEAFSRLMVSLESAWRSRWVQPAAKAHRALAHA